MTTYAAITIGGTTFTDAEIIVVTQNTSTGTADFIAEFDNRTGRYKARFDLGQDVSIYHDTVNPATGNIIFRGVVEDVQFVTEPNHERVIVRGRDYSCRLMDTYVQKIYNNTEVSVIIKDIIDSFVNIQGKSDLTYTNVQTTTKTIAHIKFNERSCFEAIKTLAEMANYDFWIDTNKDLNFKADSSISSGFTLDNSTVQSGNFHYNDDTFFNLIKLYGGQYFSGRRESFTGDGAGSVFTLQNRPHNATVAVSGTVSRGHIFEIGQASTPTGEQYLVDFDQRRIVFISGTNNGNNIPGSLVNIQVDYFRGLPIIKQTQDDASIGSYGVHMQILHSEEVTDPVLATELVKTALKQSSQPTVIGEILVDSSKIKGVQPGNTVVVNLSNQGITNKTYKVLQAVYDIRKQTLRDHSLLRLTVSASNVPERTVTDVLQQLELEIRQLKAQEVADTDLLSILKFQQEEARFSELKWFARTRVISGFGFELGHPTAGLLGTSILGPHTYSGDWILRSSGGTF